MSYINIHFYSNSNILSNSLHDMQSNTKNHYSLEVSSLFCDMSSESSDGVSERECSDP